jgi:sulfopyruvate decarboxylase TPP-binding subunit
MLDGPTVARTLLDAGITDVVWIPDSDLGTWDATLSATPGLRLVRVCREGEAFALAAGLWIGGRSPLVVIQCTGLFEAGDALRNILFDLGIPLPLLVGVRSHRAWTAGRSTDTCPRFTEPILAAWGLPLDWLAPDQAAQQLGASLKKVRDERQARAILLPE